MRVLICGSRTWEDDDDVPMILALVRGLAEHIEISGYMTLIEGEAPGADRTAAAAANGAICSVARYPADWDEYGKAAGPIRNQQMLTEGKPDVVIAFVDKPLAESRGTAHMVGIAKRAGLPVYVVEKL